MHQNALRQGGPLENSRLEVPYTWRSGGAVISPNIWKTLIWRLSFFFPHSLQSTVPRQLVPKEKENVFIKGGGMKK